MDTVLRMDEVEVGHRWEPITDLTDADRAGASEELPALARTWEKVRGTLDPRQVDDFNERLKREWAIETGIIERLYTLDRGTTRLLIEHGIDAALIASDATDQAPDQVAGIIGDHAQVVDWLFDAVTEARPVSVSFIKQLHQFMTRKQLYAPGIDMFGRRREVELRHGQFKIRPNNPMRPDGKVQQLDYFANLRVHHEWVRLGLDTENGRSEILTSFHGIGREFRGLIGVSMCFYRRHRETPDEYDDEDGYGHQRQAMHVAELQPVCNEVFQINYAERSESVQRRFTPWMERALVLALDQWRRGEQPVNNHVS